jgi:hypothetical protein
MSSCKFKKNIKNAEGGYYMILVVHKEVAKRDAS